MIIAFKELVIILHILILHNALYGFQHVFKMLKVILVFNFNHNVVNILQIIVFNQTKDIVMLSIHFVKI